MKLLLALALLILIGCEQPAPETVRFATLNMEDIRTDDLRNGEHPRLRAIAAQIQDIRPDVLLLNEIAFDMMGVPGFVNGESPGLNAERFAATFLSRSQGGGRVPIEYSVFMAPSNTGWPSGYDLNHNGEAVVGYPTPPSAAADGAAAPQTPAGREFGNDSWGFGTFPGQYAMALLVRTDRVKILAAQARTFQTFLWSSLPGALRPIDPETDLPWYPDEVWEQFPLSSKSHWDVPVQLPDGRVVHILASHPTPPAFDGDEMRNKKRNHDEIRFWGEYLNGGEFIADDDGVTGGLAADAAFVIIGDLNADPDKGSSMDNPIGTWLLSDRRVNGSFVPEATPQGRSDFPDLDADDTARWGARADYVLPSNNLRLVSGQIVRPEPGDAVTSDHFPVWIDVALDGPRN